MPFVQNIVQHDDVPAPDLFRIGHTLPVERAALQLVAVTGNVNIIKI
ncbi:Uncharacterised protein [Neisseria meningitidis]|nr:Uncharacterised protein [Neisseria meningitidis]CWP50587.1 Uncharacterised protein [Neisseria meningitidis]CWP70157.1 Uncharacterised protein [Neisseria meningitidis]CWP73892.1 Uncharacterised protein [Neisseria meningitidis]CWQ35099.1 Uncharacterised protein [Neisseria meningitidis]